MTAPSPTCQNLVMRERDGAVRFEMCGGKTLASSATIDGKPTCHICVRAVLDERAAIRRMQQHYAARRGKA